MSKGLTDEERSKIDSRIRDDFSDYFEKAGGKNFRYYHLKTVHNIVLELVDNLDADPDMRILEASALLHDIGRKEDIEDGYMDPFEGHEGHDVRGKEIVKEYLEDILNEKRVKIVQKVISNHHSKPKTDEGKILQDADEITKYGVNDLWRMFHYAAEEERPIQDTFKYFNEKLKPRLQKELEDFQFKYSRKWAEERLKAQSEAVEKIRKERNAKDFVQ